MFGLFGIRGRARSLRNLADRTIAEMDRLAAKLPTDSADRLLIESHRQRRKKMRATWAEVADGTAHELDKMMFDQSQHVHRQAMTNELSRFMGSPQQLAQYIKAIRA